MPARRNLSVRSCYAWIRPLLGGRGLARVRREPPRAGEFGGSEGVRNRESGRFSGAVGRLSWGRARGRERRPDVAKSRGKGRRNGERREVLLSASRVNCWIGRSAPNRQAPLNDLSLNTQSPREPRVDKTNRTFRGSPACWDEVIH